MAAAAPSVLTAGQRDIRCGLGYLTAVDGDAESARDVEQQTNVDAVIITTPGRQKYQGITDAKPAGLRSAGLRQ